MDFYIEKFGFVIIRKRNKEEEETSLSYPIDKEKDHVVVEWM